MTSILNPFDQILTEFMTTRQALAKPAVFDSFREKPEFLTRLQETKLIPEKGKILRTNIRGTTFCDPENLRACHNLFKTRGHLNVSVVLEPENPQPPAFMVSSHAMKLGYLPKELAQTLLHRRLSVHMLDFEPMENIRGKTTNAKNAFGIALFLGYGPRYSAP
ncbi:hypothetical protein OH491_23530 [Termitidicoccus mucosus]|uniref:HIRAN domain-containing protein n=1 Tax=Termitidicoccus mucosus TaxID=1184151 RepID=A0A178INH7_9BACT|nr:hypothetical protein AW736_02940 [Opitutaceae bacterium TSB47]